MMDKTLQEQDGNKNSDMRIYVPYKMVWFKAGMTGWNENSRNLKSVLNLNNTLALSFDYLGVVNLQKE